MPLNLKNYLRHADTGFEYLPARHYLPLMGIHLTQHNTERSRIMSIAVFIESEVESGKAQTLLVPSSTGVTAYGRVSSGGRGRAEHWQLTDLNTLALTDVTRQPVAVRLTRADMDGLAENRVTTIATKAITFHELAPEAEPRSHRALAQEIAERIINRDTTLGEYIMDSRLSNKTITFDIPVSPTRPTTRAYQPEPAFAGAPVVDLASVPDSKWSKNYIHRKVGGRTEFEIFDEALRTKTNVLIQGHAGSGKTMSVLAYGAERNMPTYSIPSTAGTSVEQLMGKYVPDPVTGSFRWVDGAVTYLCRNGGVLLINEINFLPERISTALFSLLDDRREIQLLDKDGEVIKAHPNLLIVGDMNPNYRGTRPLNQAWADRFRHVLDYPYDKTIEQRLIGNKAILEMAEQLRERFDKQELTTPISTRSLVGLMENIKSLGMEYAVYSYLNTFPAGTQREAVKVVIDTFSANIAGQMRLTTVSEAI